MSERQQPQRWSEKRKQEVVLRLASRREYSLASRLPGTGRLRFALLGGHRPKVTDEALVEAIRRVPSEVEALGFTGEGDRKVWARLRHHGVAVSKKRVWPVV